MVSSHAAVRGRALGLIGEVLVCVVHNEPDLVLGAELRDSFQRALRDRDARGVTRVDHSDHANGRQVRSCEPVSKPLHIRQQLGRGLAWDHSVGAPCHLKCHHVVEVKRLEQDHSVACIHERQHHIHVRLVRAYSDHDLHTLQAVLGTQLGSQCGAELCQPVVVAIAAEAVRGAVRPQRSQGSRRRLPVHHALRQGEQAQLAAHHLLHGHDAGLVGGEHAAAGLGRGRQLARPRALRRRRRHGASARPQQRPSDGPPTARPESPRHECRP
mmetsp:Transcript_107877/g.300816  ORF Transcript_107877/g.300816 Transcript_107877/m.300816 type:complete len:270 (-) Transcript_107877:1-810(-)